MEKAGCELSVEEARNLMPTPSAARRALPGREDRRDFVDWKSRLFRESERKPAQRAPTTVADVDREVPSGWHLQSLDVLNAKFNAGPPGAFVKEE